MNKYLLSFFFLVTFLLTSCDQITDIQKKIEAQTTKKPISKPIRFSVPPTLTDSSIGENYHGHLVADPFRWLENDHSPNVKTWVKKQNESTFSYLNQIPFRTNIRNRLKSIWSYESRTAPVKKGFQYYYLKEDGLQKQKILYGQETLDASAKVVLDPNDFVENGSASIATYAFNKEGNLLAFQIAENNSDWNAIYIKNLITDELLEDKIEWVQTSKIAWYKDGFFYSRYPEAEGENVMSGKNEFQQVFYHQLGTSPDKDELIFADRAFPDRTFNAMTTEDERFLVIEISDWTDGNALYFKDLEKESSDFIPVIENFKNNFQVIDNIGDKLLVLTDHNAANNRLILIHSQHPQKRYWEEILLESEDKLEKVAVLGGKIVASYIHNASSAIKIFSLQGKAETELILPSIGTIHDIEGSKNDSIAFFSFETFTHPNAIYQFNIATAQSTLYKKMNIDFDSDNYVTKQVWYKSYDGTKIPLFIIHKKGISLDGKRPTLLYAYGGFDISILPQFNLTRLNLGPMFLENDGIYAIANIRGGGEFGKTWHATGSKNKKQNTFNDFQAAAEYLIDQQYTDRDKLAIYGRSNGGLLIGACLTQRPDLYAVALPAAGILDMLRYDQFTIGRSWANEYGLSKDPSQFDYLYSYSPLHNVLPTKYPATLITTLAHDDRVVPAHSFKFAAALQTNQKGKNPVFIRVTNSSRGNNNKSLSKKIEEATDILSFSFYNMKETFE